MISSKIPIKIRNGKESTQTQYSVSLRTQRKDANDMVKSLKDEGLSEDAVKNTEDDIQNLTNSYSNKVDEFVSIKEEDIMKV